MVLAMEADSTVDIRFELSRVAERLHFADFCRCRPVESTTQSGQSGRLPNRGRFIVLVCRLIAFRSTLVFRTNDCTRLRWLYQ